MAKTLVLHFHEIWLKGGNRNFFLGKLLEAVRRSLEGVAVGRVYATAARVLVEAPDEAAVPEALARLARVFGIHHFAVARETTPELDQIRAAAWEEVRERNFSSFAVRVKRSDKSFPLRSHELEREVGGFLLGKLREAANPGAKVNLSEPGLTCQVEVMPRAALIWSARVAGPGGMPANTAGRLVCLLSGGFDSAVAAYKVMKRGVHLAFAHFHASPAQPGESSAPVARELVRRLVRYQFSTRLYLVPFEPVQREIVAAAPEPYRVLLYRRMMLRIAEGVARKERALGVVTGDSFSQVASQTLANMQAVDRAARLPVYRPLVGDDKEEILDLARRIGTYEVSSEPFQDCCPLFLPRSPALHASAEELDRAEASLDVPALADRAIESAVVEKYEYRSGAVVSSTRAPSTRIEALSPQRRRDAEKT